MEAKGQLDVAAAGSLREYSTQIVGRICSQFGCGGGGETPGRNRTLACDLFLYK